jgi:metal-responsive CopG/Arc/MetJ family transcriptional regulator
MPAKPVQISLDTALLERIDADPETQSHGRSAFVRVAVEEYLARKQRRRIDRRIAQAYQGHVDAAASEISDLLDVQSWPDE